MTTGEADPKKDMRKRLEQLPEIMRLNELSGDLNSKAQQAGRLTPTMILGALIFVAGLSLFLYSAHVSPDSKPAESNKDILTIVLISVGCLMLTWKRIIFVSYRTYKEYQFLGNMVRIGKYGWITLVFVISMVAIIVMIVTHAIDR